MRTKQIFLPLVALLICNTISAANYFASDISEFDAAISKAEAGDKVIMKDGVWRDVDLNITSDGRKGDEVVICAESDGGVVISGKSRLYIGADWVRVSGLAFRDGGINYEDNRRGIIVSFCKGDKSANYSTISNCYFDDYAPDNQVDTYSWIGLYGTYNRVENCFFGNEKAQRGMYIRVLREAGKEDHHTISRNFFYRPNTYNKQANGQEIIQIGLGQTCTSDSYTTIEGNMFYRCNGEFEIVSSKSSSNTISNNTFFESDGTITLRQGANSVVSGNLFIAGEAPRVGGIRVTNSGHEIYDNYFYNLPCDGILSGIVVHMGVEGEGLLSYRRGNNLNIHNNTFVGCQSNISVGQHVNTKPGENPAQAPHNTTIANNLVVTDREGAIALDTNGQDMSGVKFSNNYFEDRTGVIAMDGCVEAKYKLSGTIDVAGIAVERVVSRSVGASGDTLKSVATTKNCGPTWRWERP